MKHKDRIAQDPRVASVSRNGREWVVVMRAGWGPRLMADKSIVTMSRSLAIVRPVPLPTGRIPDLRGFRCTIPPLPKEQIPRRRHHVEVVDQLDALPLLRVRLASYKFRWVHVRETEDWCTA